MTPPTGNRARLYRTEAVVLRRRDLGEADRILTVLTPRYGKLRVVAKGARRTRSHLAGHLEPFCRTSLLVARGRDLDIISQADMVESYARLRRDERSIGLAGYFADLLDALTPDGQENAAVYDLLTTSLGGLDAGLDPFVVARAFEYGALTLLGFRPELHRCVSCGEDLMPIVNAFSPTLGGVLCPACAQSDPLAIPLSVNALKFVRLLARGEVETAFRLRRTSDLEHELEHVFQSYIRQILRRDLGSLRVLHALNG